MITYIIVEDERLAYEEMKRLMAKIRPDYQFVKWVRTITQTVDFLKNNPIDLILLDIRLADGSCFDIFEQITIQVPIIFTTAFDEFAIQAFKANSISYLLKPVDENELRAALNKYEQLCTTRQLTPDYKKLEEIIMRQYKRNRFMIKKGDEFQYIQIADIAFFYSEQKVLFLHTFTNKRYIIETTLDQIEQQLDDKVFFRVSRNCIANIHSIKKISRYFNSRLKISFQPECPHEILVSRIRVPRFVKWIDGIL